MNKQTNKQIKGKPLAYPDAVGLRYYRAIAPMINAMDRETQARLTELFEKPSTEKVLATMDAKQQTIAERAATIIATMRKKYMRIFERDLGRVVKNMLKGINNASRVGVATSLKGMGEGLTVSADFLTGPMKEEFAALTQANVSLFKTIPEVYFPKVEAAVMDSITKGEGLKDLKPFFESHSNGTRNYAQLRAMDQTRKAYTSVNIARMKKLGVTRLEWLHSHGSNDPRKLHQELSGKVFDIDKPPFIGVMYGIDIYGWGGELPNCFPGSTKVSLANGCRHIWKFWYEGNIINFVVGGETIECTPNHPILTNRGWLPAYKIEEGDYLISSNTNNIGGVDIEINESITTFDDLFIAAASSRNMITIPAGILNFHGDIPENNVDCIAINNCLPAWSESIDCKQVEQLVFANSYSSVGNGISSVEAKIFNSGFSSNASDRDSFLLAEFGHSNFVSSTSITQQDAVFLQNTGNSVSTSGVFNGDSQDTETRLILSDNITGIFPDSIRFGDHGESVANPFFESVNEMGSANSVVFAKTAKCNPGIKSGFRVQQKRVSIFRGHVYTIETFNGWYSVSPAQIISKNCRCTCSPVFDFEEVD